MKVLKFGGTSVSTAPALEKLCSLVGQSFQVQASSPLPSLIIVVSALAGVTDRLVEISSLAQGSTNSCEVRLQEIKNMHRSLIAEVLPAASQTAVLTEIEILFRELEQVIKGISLLGERSPRVYDNILSFGERLSCPIVAALLREKKFPALACDARDFIITDQDFGHAHVRFEETEKKARAYFGELFGKIPVVTGFIARSADGDTTTLGRGGSDYTASILGACLDASDVEIWTDVNGVMTADPKKAPNAKNIPEMSFAEAMELSHFGAKVLFAPTMRPLRDKKIPLWVKNTFHPEQAGTRISERGAQDAFLARAVTSIPKVAFLRLQGSGMVGIAGVSARLFAGLAHAGISVIFISQASSEQSICIAVPPEHGERARALIRDVFVAEFQAGTLDDLVLETDVAIVSLVGDSMRLRPGVSGKLFHALGRNAVNIIAIAQGSSERNISVVLRAEEEAHAVKLIHDSFFLPTHAALQVFLVGMGKVGSALIEQIFEAKENLAKKFGIDIQIVGLANSRRYLFAPQGLSRTWREDFEGKALPYAHLSEFFSHAKYFDRESLVFVDCTASELLPEFYHEVLSQGVPVVTANKKGQTEAHETYQVLNSHYRSMGVKFLYEASVGAGLPVLSTMRSLLASGDELISVQGVLSGTLSFLLNTYDGSMPFSKRIAEAHKKGYTEPDPRDDLNGMDVARKILILARESGAALELEDIAIEPLVPAEALKTDSLEEFFSVLEQYDDAFLARYESAMQKGEKLRYVARFEHGKASLGLESLPVDNPFASLSGTDNMIAFSSKRYSEQPLVIRGPGAGAQVTAAGVLSDIISTAEKIV